MIAVRWQSVHFVLHIMNTVVLECSATRLN